jgi:hypothetical protein
LLTTKIYCAPFHATSDDSSMSPCGSTIAAFRKVVKAQGWPHDNGDDPSFYAAQVWRPALVGNLPARRSQQTSAWRPGRVLLVSQIQGDWRLLPLRTWTARWPRNPCCAMRTSRQPPRIISSSSMPPRSPRFARWTKFLACLIMRAVSAIQTKRLRMLRSATSQTAQEAANLAPTFCDYAKSMQKRTTGIPVSSLESTARP